MAAAAATCGPCAMRAARAAAATSRGTARSCCSTARAATHTSQHRAASGGGARDSTGGASCDADVLASDASAGGGVSDVASGGKPLEAGDASSPSPPRHCTATAGELSTAMAVHAATAVVLRKYPGGQLTSTCRLQQRPHVRLARNPAPYRTRRRQSDWYGAAAAPALQ